jgi:hypothetical protein
MKGLRLIIQIALVIGAGILAYMLYSSIMQPVEYKNVREAREQIIIDKLLNIKELQVEYKNINGDYCASFDTLKLFYLEGQMPVVLKQGSNDTLTEERALELGLISRDTSYVYIRDTLLKNVENFKIETIDIVPFTEGKVRFNMEAGKVPRANFEVPVFLVQAFMKDYLADINQQELLENDLILLPKDGKFPGLQLGSMDEPSTDGSW